VKSVPNTGIRRLALKGLLIIDDESEAEVLLALFAHLWGTDTEFSTNKQIGIDVICNHYMLFHNLYNVPTEGNTKWPIINPVLTIGPRASPKRCIHPRHVQVGSSLERENCTERLRTGGRR